MNHQLTHARSIKKRRSGAGFYRLWNHLCFTARLSTIIPAFASDPASLLRGRVFSRVSWEILVP